ncbi:MAG: protein-export chaperone SecB [Alphaproteobacteria bacterium]|nr:protein-export chaperone SecB [Alphaproteobacteria bacterium]
MAQTTAGNGQQETPAAPAEAAQRLIVSAQYIKDLSFENPRAPHSLQQETAAPSVDINVDVNAHNLNPDTYEVVLTVKATAKLNDDPLFLLELSYGAVVTVHNVPRDMLAAVLLVETPRLMFPFARNIVADATRDGGFPPLMVNPIDFTELLRRSAAEQQAGGGEAPSAG